MVRVGDLEKSDIKVFKWKDVGIGIGIGIGIAIRSLSCSLIVCS